MDTPWRWVVLPVSLLASVVAPALSPAATVGGSSGDQCVACHSDPAKLKALAQEPPIVEAEGEG